MDNYLINTLAYGKSVRIIFAEITDLIGAVRTQGSTNKALNQNFAELIATMCLMAGPIDAEEKMQLKITGDNANKNMIGSLEGNGNVRGLVSETFESHISAPIGNGSIFGKHGTVTVRHDTGAFGYTGVTEAKYKSVAKNLEHYYLKSEQLPTSIQLFISKTHTGIARGVMLQLLPGAPKSIIGEFNQNIVAKKNLIFDPSFTFAVNSLQEHFLDDIVYMATKPLHYQCACTKEMFYGVIFSLSPQEIDEIISKKQVLEASCSMCGKQYSYTHKEVATLFGIQLQDVSKRQDEISR